MRLRQAILPAVLLTVAAGTAVWSIGGMPGSPATCVATDSCDCESVGPGPIRQPANAWSSLAVTAAGVGIVATAGGRGRARDRLLGTAIALSGTAAFAAHSSTTEWAYRFDGAAIVLVVALPAIYDWRPGIPPVTAAILATSLAGTGAALGATGTNTLAVALAAVFLAAQPRRLRTRRPAPALAAALLLGGGAVLRAAADSDGPWCDPGSLAQGHAVWHVAAAAGLLALVGYLRSGDRRRTRPEGGCSPPITPSL